MPTTPFGLAGPTYETRDGLWQASRCKNWYPSGDLSGHAKSKISLQPCPGLHTFCDVTTASGSPGIRGLFAGDNRLFVDVAGRFVEVFEDGSLDEIGGYGSGRNAGPVRSLGTLGIDRHRRLDLEGFGTARSKRPTTELPRLYGWTATTSSC